MTTRRRLLHGASVIVRAVAGVAALRRLARAATVEPPVRSTITPTASISVVVPARDEATRIEPLLDAVVDAPGVDEVIVVDDRSSDGTATIAARAGARVLSGRELPAGWAGKAWALQQGIEAATGDWVVTLDADTRPAPELPTALVARAAGDRLDLLTVGGRFDCPTPGAQWLHPAMLTTLVYRFGPPGAATARPDRTMANGQCMALHREGFLRAGGMAAVAGEVVEDIALARRLAADGRRVAFLDGSDVLTVRMFESFRDTWTGWGRSLALPGVEPLHRQVADLVLVVVAQALPLVRVVTRRADPIDVVLLLARMGTLAGIRRAYTSAGPAYWSSPLADPLAVLAIGLGIARRGRQSWRGRTYG